MRDFIILFFVALIDKMITNLDKSKPNYKECEKILRIFHMWEASIKNETQTNLRSTLCRFIVFFLGTVIACIEYKVIFKLLILDHKIKKKNYETFRLDLVVASMYLVYVFLKRSMKKLLRSLRVL